MSSGAEKSQESISEKAMLNWDEAGEHSGSGTLARHIIGVF